MNPTYQIADVMDGANKSNDAQFTHGDVRWAGSSDRQFYMWYQQFYMKSVVLCEFYAISATLYEVSISMRYKQLYMKSVVLCDIGGQRTLL